MKTIMKTIIIIACLVVTVAVAQTVTAPQSVDYRYTFQWDDPNPAGSVSNWVVYANGAGAITQRVVTGVAVSYSILLGGVPAGIYTLYLKPISALGDEGEQSTNHMVIWPGGNGKLKGAVNLRSNK